MPLSCAGANEPRAIIGWMAGSIDQDDYQLRSICVELKVTIVNVEYRYDVIPLIERGGYEPLS